MIINVSKQRWFYFLCSIFFIINFTAIAFDFYWVSIVPIILFFCFLLLFKVDVIILALAFLVPLSIRFDDIGFGLGINVPDEPLIITVAIVAVFKFFIDEEYDFKVFRHPITFVILFHLFWIFITSCFSEFPVVSFKYFVSRLWYVIVFYFLGVILFKHFNNIKKYLWLYIISLTVVVVITLYKHSKYNFSLSKSYTIIEPFFIDHGIYAATITLFMPMLVCFALFNRKIGLNFFGWMTSLIVLTIFSFGIYFSYTRAAWISIVVAAALVIPLILRIRFNIILLTLFSLSVLTYSFQDEIVYAFSKNEQKSADGFLQHFQSISNIKTDPSNTERINRWTSAIAMFEEKPVLGFGPGAFSFCYAPYQQFKYKTVISTNFGDGGNAHSEYLNPLAEAGLIGLLSILLIIYFVLNTGFRLYYSARKIKIQIFSIAITLGIVTYFVHGIMNNYFESDKIGAVLWAFFGMLTAMDLYHDKQKKNKLIMHELQ